MASTREERFLMKQRGAGARHLQDFGFDLAIPETQTPSQPGSSPRKRKTPKSSQTRSATRQASQSTSAQSQASAEPTRYTRRTRGSAGNDAIDITQQDEEGSATKRRRLSSSSPANEAMEDVSVTAEPLPDIAEEPLEDEVEPEAQDVEQSVVSPAAGLSATFLETPHSPQRRRRIVQYSGSGKKPGTTVQPLTALTPAQRNTIRQLRPTSASTTSAKKRKKRHSVNLKPKGSNRRRSLLAGPLSPDAALSVVDISDDEAPASAVVDNAQRESDNNGAEAVTQPTGKAKQPVGRRMLNALRNFTTRRKSTTPAPHEPSSSVKRKRGRPRKSSPVAARVSEGNDVGAAPGSTENTVPATKKRGRPRRSSPVIVEADDGSNNEEGFNEEGGNEEGGDEIASASNKRGRPRKSSPVLIEAQERDGQNEEADEVTSPPRRKGRPRKSSPVMVEADPNDGNTPHEESTAETPLVLKRRGRPRESGAQSGTPSVTRPKNKARAQVSSSVAEPSSSTGAALPAESSSEAPNAISVGVYRMTGAENLNPDTDEDNDGELAAGPMPKKSGVNAIDVLNQICGEVVEKHLVRIRAGGKKEKDNKKKKEWQEARKLVAQFGEDMETRLFQMTTALDHHHALTTQLRHATKRQTEARAELLALRTKRHELAAQIEAVRAQHEAEAKANRDEHELHDMLHDIQLAVQRGRAAERTADEEGLRPVGLELRLHGVAEQVSAADGRAGMVGKVRELNEMLERAIAAG